MEVQHDITAKSKAVESCEWDDDTWRRFKWKKKDIGARGYAGVGNDSSNVN